MNRYHQQNRCMLRFHGAGAVRPETTSTLDQVGVRDSLVFRYPRSRGVIVDVGGGRFHLDPDAERKFRQRRLVFTASVLAVVLVVIVVLILFAMARAAETPSADNAIKLPIRVVKTWQDLLDQPAVSVGSGTARLGIEAHSAPCMSGVLLYCLTDGYSQPREWQAGNRFGPFQVEIRHETDTAGHAVKARSMERPNPPDIGHSAALFRKSIPLDRPGKYRIRVCSPDGELLATTEVTATRTAVHPWMPLAPAARRDEDRGGFDAVGSVRNRAKGIAIPRFDGMEPMLFRSDGPDSKVRRFPGERLPTLVPEDAGTVLTAKTSGTDLVVESNVNIILARPDWHFLARWWVNGKPYIPAQLNEFSDKNGLVIIGKRLLLHLDFDPRRLAAAPGDTIDLQLLYCKNGWELVQPGSGLLHASLDAEGPELLLSNRIRIVREKDTDHPGN